MPEMMDLYDCQRRPTGETAVRGESIPEGRYKLGTVVWVRNARGQFLMSRRHPDKKFPLYWEPTGGGVQAGETPKQAAIRELSEELGIKAEASRMTRLFTRFREEESEFQDVWLTQWDGEISELTLQPGEVIDARWTDYEDVGKLLIQDIVRETWEREFAPVPHAPAAICEMRMEDYDEIYGLWSHMPGMGLNDVDDTREGIERFLKRNPATCFVAKTADGLMGTILCGHDGRRAHLYHAAVRPEARGMGLGTALVKAALEGLRKEGIAKASLLVFADNLAGNRFWQKLGFSGRDDVNYLNIQLLQMHKYDPK